jgi:hypothetical protein
VRFHHSLDGNGGAPDEWIISRVCEEFHCLPSEAIEAIEDDVGGLLFTIIELRSYARAKEDYENTPMDKRKKSYMMDKVSEIKTAIAKEKIKQFEEEGRG